MVREHLPVSNWAASQLREKAKEVFMRLMISLLANSLVTLARCECSEIGGSLQLVQKDIPQLRSGP